MKVTLYSNKEKKTLELPVNIEGSFILTDNNQNQIVSINSENNDWVMSVSSGISIIQNGYYSKWQSINENHSLG